LTPQIVRRTSCRLQGGCRGDQDIAFRAGENFSGHTAQEVLCHGIRALRSDRNEVRLSSLSGAE
jgi:hypothetical protein